MPTWGSAVEICGWQRNQHGCASTLASPEVRFVVYWHPTVLVPIDLLLSFPIATIPIAQGTSASRTAAATLLPLLGATPLGVTGAPRV